MNSFNELSANRVNQLLVEQPLSIGNMSNPDADPSAAPFSNPSFLVVSESPSILIGHELPDGVFPDQGVDPVFGVAGIPDDVRIAFNAADVLGAGSANLPDHPVGADGSNSVDMSLLDPAEGKLGGPAAAGDDTSDSNDDGGAFDFGRTDGASLSHHLSGLDGYPAEVHEPSIVQDSLAPVSDSPAGAGISDIVSGLGGYPDQVHEANLSQFADSLSDSPLDMPGDVLSGLGG